MTKSELAATKKKIIEKIRELYKKTGEVPGARALQNAGITKYELSLAGNITDLQREAGFEPNLRTQKISEEVRFKYLAELTRKEGEVPTMQTLRRLRIQNPEMPSVDGWKSGRKRLTRLERMEATLKWCRNSSEWQDIIPILERELLLSNQTIKTKAASQSNNVGEVYMFRAGRNYTIGKANNAIVRHYQHQRGNAEELKIVATIRSAFPFAVESYWHSRFKNKKIRPSWYKLDKEDIEAFKSAKFPE